MGLLRESVAGVYVRDFAIGLTARGVRKRFGVSPYSLSLLCLHVDVVAKFHRQLTAWRCIQLNDIIWQLHA